MRTLRPITFLVAMLLALPALAQSTPSPLSLNLGGGPNDRSGDPVRTLFQQVQGGVNNVLSARGQPNGFAALDANGLVPIPQVPLVGSLTATAAGKLAVEQSIANGLTVTASPQGSALTRTLADWLSDAGNVSRTMPNDGLIGDGLSARRFIITHDQQDARVWNSPANAAGPGFGMALRVAHTVGGPGLYGGRIALNSAIIHEAPDNPGNLLPQFVGLTGAAYGVSQGGFGGTVQNPRGGLFAGNFFAQANAGYTNLQNLTGLEVNATSNAGSSMTLRTGIQVVTYGPVRGAIDAGIGISGEGVKYGILIGDQNDYGVSPVDANGTLIGTWNQRATNFVVATGIDLTGFGFSDSVLKSGGYKILANGSVSAGTPTGAGQVNYDFRTSGSGLGTDFDARIAVAGGNSTNGQGTMSLIANRVSLFGTLNFNSPEMTTTAAAGTATLPNTAFGYMTIMVGGVAKKLLVYNY